MDATNAAIVHSFYEEQVKTVEKALIKGDQCGQLPAEAKARPLAI